MTSLDIMIPYWGDARLLRSAVESVLAQSDPRWRLTVIDDCDPSPDASEYIASLDNSKVVYRRNPRNLGITGNFRRAVELTDAPYVTIMGFDDMLLPNYVAVVLRAAHSHPQSDIIQPGVVVIDADGSPSKPLVDRVKRWLAPTQTGQSIVAGERLAASLLRGNWLYWPALAFRTETIRKYHFRDDLAVIQDLALLVDIAFDGGRLVYDPDVAFVYRRHESSASQRALYDGTRFRDERRYYAGAYAQSRAANWPRAARAARLRPMSRLHAVAELPGIVRIGERPAVRAAFAHIFL